MIPIYVLRNLGKFDRCWYIVADLSVLLEDMAFIKGYIYGDETCKLLTPVTLLSELEIMRERDPRRGDGGAAIAQRYLVQLEMYSRHVKFDAAVHCDEAPASCDEAAVRCCQLAMVHDMHVVLVTNKPALRTRARHAGIHAYTLAELRRDVPSVIVGVDRRRDGRRRRRGGDRPHGHPHHYHYHHHHH